MNEEAETTATATEVAPEDNPDMDNVELYELIEGAIAAIRRVALHMDKEGGPMGAGILLGAIYILDTHQRAILSAAAEMLLGHTPGTEPGSLTISD